MSLTAPSASVTLAKASVVETALAVKKRVKDLNTLFTSGGKVAVGRPVPGQPQASQDLSVEDVAAAFGADGVKLAGACAAFVAALAEPAA